ncbi:MAG: metal-dependent hydrolase [Janthinobacterium lividum]
MFIGHFGLSFAAKKVAPQVGLGTLFIATQFADLLWPFLLVLGVEKVAIVPGYTKTNAFDFLFFPYTHSLLMGFAWGALLGSVYWLFKRDSRGAVVIGLCVLSHWFLDLVVHVADLPLTPFSGYKVGLGLWNQVLITLTIEAILFFTGAYIYGTFTKARNKTGKWAFWVLVILLFLLQLSNTFGPTPPDSVSILFFSFEILTAVIVLLAHWVDKNRGLA